MNSESKSDFCALIREVVLSEITFDIFYERIDKFPDKNFLQEEVVLDIYHAIQHFSIDGELDIDRKGDNKKALDKILEIVDCFENETVENTQLLIKQFFLL
ncbi:hypothetical protein [Oceanicoccus sagamiensis]|uniref:Colicin D immunity protein domain-containing protein n=1 Tax=Oceanicoccus sagamiensis TaxID=716816 RepID=A0A1X9N755_9GAMM|nr:hypothetical protein [Oceanicoccus sagamiensis]ARN73930.1 hypothetical protein BST96_07255 [Oceanicoccus sagamiensis]